MEHHLMVLVISTYLGIIQNGEATVTLTYTSDFLHGGQFQVLDNNHITLICQFDKSAETVKWIVDDEIIYAYDMGITSEGDTDYKGRITDYEFTDQEHMLSFVVNRANDEGKLFQCRVTFDAVSEETAEWRMPEVLVLPTLTVEADPSDNLVEGDKIEVSCTSTAANPEATLLLYSGDKQLASGTEPEVTVNVDMTRQMNGLAFQCRAVPSEPEKYDYSVKSNSKICTVLFPPVLNNLNPEASLSVIEGYEKTLSCTTGTANPKSEMVWSKDGITVTSSITSQVLDGEYGGKVLQSNYTFTADKSDNGQEVACVPNWRGDVLDNYEETVSLDIKYPPVVTIVGHSSVDTGAAIVLNCNVEEGNPRFLNYFFWDFKAKYTGTNSQAMPSQRENRELRIDAAVFSDAGRYTCTAGNSVRGDKDYIDIIVQYPPQLYNPDAPLIFYSEVNSLITLSLTVRAYPPISNLGSAFNWQKQGQSQPVSNGIVTSLEVSEEVFVSQLQLQSTGDSDYGEYTVTVGNGIHQPATFEVKHYKTGPPEPPQYLSVIGIAAESVLVSWVVGLSGGSDLTFTVRLTELTTDTTYDIDTAFINPPTGSVLEFLVEDLMSQSMYNLSVLSINSFNGKSEAGSNETSFTTRELPVVNEDTLKMEIQESEAILSWEAAVDVSYSTVFIEQCNITCIEYDVTNNTDQLLTVSLVDGPKCFLVIYQDGLEVFRSEPFMYLHDETGPPEAPRSVTVVAVASEKVLLSWVVGLGGGLPQTFIIEVTDLTSDTSKYIDTGHSNPDVGDTLEYLITDLSPGTLYNALVISRNSHSGGSLSSSDEKAFTTLDKPDIDEGSLLIRINGSEAVLSWDFETDSRVETTLIIEQCNSTCSNDDNNDRDCSSVCIEHDVTDNREQTLFIKLDKGSTFYLVIYLNNLESFRSEAFMQDVSDTTIPTPGSPESDQIAIGGIVGGVVAFLVILVICIVVFVCLYKKRRIKERTKEQNPVHGAVYEGLDDKLDDKPDDNQAVYEPLQTQPEPGSWRGEKNRDILRIPEDGQNKHLQGQYDSYSRVRITMHKKIYQIDDLVDFAQVLCKGRYFTSKSANLFTEAGKVEVVVKSLNEDAALFDAESLFNRIQCLETIGKHKGIVETFPINLTDYGPMSLKLVTKYYPEGNLSMYLKKFQEKDVSKLNNITFEILEGLCYLDGIKPVVLHFCLSSRHVLIDQDEGCKLTGFDFEDKVLQRELQENKKGICDNIAWKAPETLRDCKSHTKASDIWSFGVLLHEIYSCGKIPYEGMSEKDIKQAVKRGEKLTKPTDCLDDIYNIMKKCWEIDPTKRPTIRDLKLQLQEMNIGYVGDSANDYEHLPDPTNDIYHQIEMVT